MSINPSEIKLECMETGIILRVIQYDYKEKIIRILEMIPSLKTAGVEYSDKYQARGRFKCYHPLATKEIFQLPKISGVQPNFNEGEKEKFEELAKFFSQQPKFQNNYWELPQYVYPPA